MATDQTQLPRLLPMLATSGELPPVASEAQWSFEMKWDGVRALAYVADGHLELMARSGRDITVAYPELAPLANELRDQRFILDGEIVAFGADGRPSFAELQHRMHVRDRAQVASLVTQHPVAYLVFDLLHLDQTSLLALPYQTRRETLEALDLRGPSWHTPAVFAGLGAQALETSEQQGLEGVVAKRLDSRYEAGRRSDSWIKVKHWRTGEVVIGGWRPGEGSRHGTVGSLLCGMHDDTGALRYVGRVGTGFSMSALRQLRQRFSELSRATSPFGDSVPAADARDAFWVEPVLVGDVSFAQWTNDGRLWHPRWRGLRTDKPPVQVLLAEHLDGEADGDHDGDHDGGDRQ